MGRLDDKIALVIGSGRGIGRAIAEKLTTEGATVAVADIDETAAKGVAEALGDGALGIRTDVTSQESVHAAVEQVTDRFGRIDILINNAGWDKAQPFLDSDEADWDRIIDINLRGTLRTTKAVLPGMVERGAGSVVNLGSDAARVGSSGESVYSAAKGGIVSFTKTLAREMARHQITVNCVCPGSTDTDLFASIGGDDPKLRESLTKAIPLRRLGQPQDLANVITFLASERAGYVTGQTVSVSGGLTMS